jgi:hypothetical protein
MTSVVSAMGEEPVRKVVDVARHAAREVAALAQQALERAHGGVVLEGGGVDVDEDAVGTAARERACAQTPGELP